MFKNAAWEEVLCRVRVADGPTVRAAAPCGPYPFEPRMLWLQCLTHVQLMLPIVEIAVAGSMSSSLAQPHALPTTTAGYSAQNHDYTSYRTRTPCPSQNQPHVLHTSRTPCIACNPTLVLHTPTTPCHAHNAMCCTHPEPHVTPTNHNLMSCTHPQPHVLRTATTPCDAHNPMLRPQTTTPCPAHNYNPM